MADKEMLYAKLIKLLAGMDFDKRYYGFYEAQRGQGKKGMSTLRLEDFQTALAKTSLDFSYQAKEKFFSHTETFDHCAVGLNVAFPYSSAVEFILSVKTRQGDLGDPFSSLAHDVGEFRDPDFHSEPEFPNLPFSSKAELHEAVQFGVSLFQDAKHAILSYKGWND
jgi:hypothetical protein